MLIVVSKGHGELGRSCIINPPASLFTTRGWQAGFSKGDKLTLSSFLKSLPAAGRVVSGGRRISMQKKQTISFCPQAGLAFHFGLTQNETKSQGWFLSSR
jgi:hypothetical protein